MRTHAADHRRYVAKPHMSNVSGRVLALQSVRRFSMVSTFIGGCTGGQESPVDGFRSSFVADDPMDIFLFFSRRACPISMSALQLTGLVAPPIIFLFNFRSYLPSGCNDIGVHGRFAGVQSTGRLDCVARSTSPFTPAPPRMLSCPFGVPVESVLHFDPSSSSQPTMAVSCRRPCVANSL